MVPNLVGQNAACGDIIAVAEPPWHAEDLVVAQDAGLFQHSIDMHPLCLSAGLFKGVCCLDVAVRAGGSQDEYAWCGHFFKL